MNSQDYRNLQEAYLDVYDSDLREEQEFESWVTELLDEGYDLSDYNWDEMYEIYNDILNEGIGSTIKNFFGKKKEPEAPKPLSRGAELRARYNTGPDKSETSAKRKILDLTRKRAESDKKKYGDSTYSRSVADKSAAAHERYLKAGYNKYGADRSDSGGMGGSGGSGRGSKAAKRAAALATSNINASYEPDLFDYIMEYLMIEGYADTDENALVIMANMSEEWRDSIVEEKKPRPYTQMMQKSDKLASSDNKNKQKRAAKIYIAANDPKNN